MKKLWLLAAMSAAPLPLLMSAHPASISPGPSSISSITISPSSIIPITISSISKAPLDYRQLAREHAAAMAEFNKKVARVMEEEGAEAAEDYRYSWNPTHSFVERFNEAAMELAGKESSLPFLQWIVRYGIATEDEEESNMPASSLDALRRIIAMGATAGNSQWFSNLNREHYEIGKERTWNLIEAAIELTTTSAAPKKLTDYARFSRASLCRTYAPGNHKYSDCLADIKRIIAADEYPMIIAAAEAILFELETLHFGMPAMEIAAADTDGVDFKLSDYRGKVVMLDFWGNW